MKLSQQSQSLIESTIQKAMDNFPCGCERSIVTDIYLQANQSAGELVIFNDEDEVLANCIIKEWIDYNGSDFFKDMERVFTSILNRMKEKCIFDKPSILQPYSFVLVDEEKETIAELLIIDDDMMLVNEELLKGLDKELDDFLKELLEK
ncbi:hypothetical protein [Bacteroides sp. 224]|uniref:hypothetical protein n=1 Tax=Bacteroides sp. 224 TaxID=2302936 RepID=UPI0013D5B115|nr:hypothetical protein [Bacteroides sp. 224]NDV65568.1 hypothetical protein [Bacteroides sp. 224]